MHDVTPALPIFVTLLIGGLLLFLTIATILLPFYVIGIYSQMKELNRKVQHLIKIKEWENGQGE